jgi:hypothetical protein
MSDVEFNPVGALQERCMAQKIGVPIYTDLERGGLEHSPVFTTKVTVNEFEAFGTSSTKKLAKKEAAKNMLRLLDERTGTYTTLILVPSKETFKIYKIKFNSSCVLVLYFKNRIVTQKCRLSDSSCGRCDWPFCSIAFF